MGSRYMMHRRNLKNKLDKSVRARLLSISIPRLQTVKQVWGRRREVRKS